jgi:hypothetical protein
MLKNLFVGAVKVVVLVTEKVSPINPGGLVDLDVDLEVLVVRR